LKEHDNTKVLCYGASQGSVSWYAQFNTEEDERLKQSTSNYCIRSSSSEALREGIKIEVCKKHQKTEVSGLTG